MSLERNLYLSYQGAFGPPTFGHYKTMDLLTEKVKKEFGDNYKINMFFMPTSESNSKPHLKLSKDSRIKILNNFCERLGKKYTNIIFRSSTIEYEIYEEKGSSHSIYTIEKLRKISKPGDLIFLGMGLDNLYQIPYWFRIKEFSENIDGIYYVERKIDEKDLKIVDDFIVSGQELLPDNTEKLIKFQKILPWSMKPLDIFDKFMKFKSEINYTKIDTSTDSFLKGFDVTSLYPKNNVINISLPNFISLDEYIVPDISSSMIRFFIYKFIETGDIKFKDYVKNLIFSFDYNNIELLEEIIKEYQNIFKIIGNPIDDNFEEKYLKIFENLTEIGNKK